MIQFTPEYQIRVNWYFAGYRRCRKPSEEETIIMLKKIQYAALVAAVMFTNAVQAQEDPSGGLDLTAKTNTIVDTLEALGLPVLILAIIVGVFGYWFKAVGIGFAAAIVIGGVIFGAAPEIAGFLLT